MDTGLHTSPGQEDKEHPGAVKQNKHHQQDDTEEGVTLLWDKLVDDDEEHVVTIDTKETHRYGSKIVKVVQTEELSVRVVGGYNKDDLHSKND